LIAKLVTSADRMAGHLTVEVAVLNSEGWYADGVMACSVPLGAPFAHLHALGGLAERFPHAMPEPLTTEAIRGVPYVRTTP